MQFMNTRDTPVFSEISIFPLIRDIIESIESHKSCSRETLMEPASRINDASLRNAFFRKFPQGSKQRVQSRTRVISYDHQSKQAAVHPQRVSAISYN